MKALNIVSICRDYIKCFIILVAPVLRDGVPERRRLDVPHSAERSLRSGSCSILRRGDSVRPEIPTQKRHRLPVNIRINFYSSNAKIILRKKLIRVKTKTNKKNLKN